MSLVNGIHHVTFVSHSAQEILDFYVKSLHMRLIKKTVNFDDPTAYHLYFGDELGSVGTALTSFPYPHGREAQVGNGVVAVTSLAVPVGSLPYWAAKLGELSVPFEGPKTLNGRVVIQFADSDGLMLELTESKLESDKPLYQSIEAVTLYEADLDPTKAVLEKILGYALVNQLGKVSEFRNTTNPDGGTIYVDVDPTRPNAHGGQGGVHHVAYRTEGEATQLEIRHQLLSLHMSVSPVMNRDYFKSIYFREPGGVLFEIATDGPGFTLDEPVENLGESLQLPAQFQSRRKEILERLPSLI